MRISDWSSDVCSSDLRLSTRRVWRGFLSHSSTRKARYAVTRRCVGGGGVCRALRSAGPATQTVARCIQEPDRSRGRRSLNLFFNTDAATLSPIDRKSVRVGKECVSKCRSRWAPDHQKNKEKINKRHII